MIKIYEARTSAEYKRGYEDAVAKLREIIEAQKNGDNSGGGLDDDMGGGDSQSDMADSTQLDAEAESAVSEKTGQSGAGKAGGKGKSSKDKAADKSNQNSSNSRGNGSQGVVRPEDCDGSSMSQVPGTPGGMIDRATGDDIAKSEGYPQEGGNEDATAREWKDQALKEASKMRGIGAGEILRTKIETLYKTSTNWKKELRNIVGSCISQDDKRQAYANKNVLISQNRIARTDKDKFDAVDYIIAFIDSSGSMSDDMLRKCLLEVYNVALQKKPMNIVVVQCDTKVQDVKIYTSLRELEKDFKTSKVKGGGGTELKPCWDLLKTDKRFARRMAELVLVFTDGYCNQYKRDPRTMQNLLWVILDNPSLNIQYKDIKTKMLHFSSKDLK